ncbi:MAG: energy transducer TonB [bacterium]|nr:energy transducer TonB [Candidatus Colisoma equi]
MKNLILSFVASLLLHGLVAAGLIAYLEYAPHPDVLATLDLSSVELSFAEQVEETAAVAPSPASIGRTAPSPPQEEKPPEVKPEKPLHRELGEIKFPEPREDARLKTEDVVKKVPPKDNSNTQTLKQSNPAPIAPRQARLDAPPKPKRNIKPDYPKGARQRGEQGDVILEIRVNAEGTVDDVKVATSSGFGELDEAAIRAARAAKFSPARSGREAVAAVARLKLSFKLK